MKLSLKIAAVATILATPLGAETVILECKFDGNCLMMDNCPLVDLPVRIFLDEQTKELIADTSGSIQSVSRTEFDEISVFSTIEVKASEALNFGEYLSIVYYHENGQAVMNISLVAFNIQGNELRAGHLTGTCETPK